MLIRLAPINNLRGEKTNNNTKQKKHVAPSWRESRRTESRFSSWNGRRTSNSDVHSNRRGRQDGTWSTPPNHRPPANKTSENKSRNAFTISY